MKDMFVVTTILGKIIASVLRLLGRGGGALPGLVVERVNKTYLSTALAKLPKGTVIVTGTNGKTTTTKILSALLEKQGLRVLTNETGSNFVRGAIAAVLQRTSWIGTLPYDIAVFELDEAYARKFVELVRPAGVVGLNILRDQMDRFGEIDTTAKYVQKTAQAATEWLVLNANDPRIAAAAAGTDVPVRWFGHASSLAQIFAGDDQHHAGEEITFFQAAEPNELLLSFGADSVEIISDGASSRYVTHLKGSHNAINIAAAIAAARCVVQDPTAEAISQVLLDLRPAFGRGEEVLLSSGGVLQLQLIKNPSGFTHSLASIQDEPFDVAAIAINDNYADGRDVSWLWDVNFTALSTRTVVCGGSRGSDMAVRLKYDGIVCEAVFGDFKELLTNINNHTKQRAIIFCTYTAMLRIRKLLQKEGVTMEQVAL